jgi:hypothetical protein
LVELGDQGEGGSNPISITLAGGERPEIGIAEPRGGFDERVEHRLQVEGRAANDLQHIAGRGLVFERLFEVVRAFA